MYREPPRFGQVALRISRVVKERPGIHFRALGRAAGVSSVGQLRHHIDRLQRAGMVVEVEEGRFKRYFASGDHEPRLRPAYARFARPVPRQLGQLLLARPMNRTDLRRSLGLADSTLGYHLSRMVRSGDLARSRGRNCCLYSLTDPELARRIILGPSPHGEGAPTPPTPAASPLGAPMEPLAPALAPALEPPPFLEVAPSAEPEPALTASAQPPSLFEVDPSREPAAPSSPEPPSLFEVDRSAEPEAVSPEPPSLFEVDRSPEPEPASQGAPSEDRSPGQSLTDDVRRGAASDSDNSTDGVAG